MPKLKALHVICPGCLKRFQVSMRFAGMQGPCPNCGVIISIPKESVQMRGTGDIELDGMGTERKGSQRTETLPVPRLEIEISPVQAGRYGVAIFGVVLLTFVLGCIPMHTSLRSFVGVLELCLIAFPLTLFGYQMFRDREKIFTFSGEDLHCRSGVVAAGYVILWLCLEYFLVAMQAGVFVNGLYFVAFALLAALIVHPFLELKLGDSLLHYCTFSIAVVLLRFCLGLGWFWESGVRYSTAPPSPFLLGM